MFESRVNYIRTKFTIYVKKGIYSIKRTTMKLEKEPRSSRYLIEKEMEKM